MSQNGWRDFVNVCMSAQDEQTLSAVLELFLTPEEKDSMGMRCLIIKALLAQEKTQREMAQELHVSIAKITRGSNELKRTTSKTRKFLQDAFG